MISSHKFTGSTLVSGYRSVHCLMSCLRELTDTNEWNTMQVNQFWERGQISFRFVLWNLKSSSLRKERKRLLSAVIWIFIVVWVLKTISPLTLSFNEQQKVLDFSQGLHWLQGGQSTLSQQRIHTGVTLLESKTLSAQWMKERSLSFSKVTDRQDCVTADLHKELHGVVGVVFCAVIVLLQDVE